MIPFDKNKIAATFELSVAQDKARDTLISDATYCALGGGSRSGKTFLLVRQVLLRAIKAPNSRHAIFRFRFNALKASVINDTWKKVIKLCFPELVGKITMNKTDWYATLPNGSEIWFCGLDDSDRVEKILGMEFATLYFNECSQIPYHSVTTALTRLAQNTAGALKLKAFFDFNPPSKRHWTYILFIKKEDPEDRQPKEEFDIAFYLINPKDNIANLDPAYLKFLESLPEKKRNRFLYGRFADDSDGALWDDNLLAQNRCVGNKMAELPDWMRVVIAVDPSGTKGKEDERSDEVGITVVALGIDGHAYLLEDLSGNFKPEEWSQVVNDAFIRHKADRVIGEINYGGDMVRAVLQAKNKDLPYEEVRATRGKVIRAEPVSELYQLHKVHHVGYFPELEDQLCAMTIAGYMGLRSPDRADSLIWAITALFPSLVKTPQELNMPTPNVKTASRSASRFDRKLR